MNTEEPHPRPRGLFQLIPHTWRRHGNPQTRRATIQTTAHARTLTLFSSLPQPPKSEENQ